MCKEVPHGFVQGKLLNSELNTQDVHLVFSLAVQGTSDLENHTLTHCSSFTDVANHAACQQPGTSCEQHNKMLKTPENTTAVMNLGCLKCHPVI